MNEIISNYKELLVYIDKVTARSGIIIDGQIFSRVGTNCILILYVEDDDSSIFNTIITTVQTIVDAIVLGEDQPALFEPWYELSRAITSNHNENTKRIISALPDCAIKNKAVSEMIRAEMEKDH